jgi:DNA gyrase subunit A
MVNLLPLDEDERVNAVLPVRNFDADKYVFMATSHGTVKKTSLEAFSRRRANGIIALELRDDDRLVDVAITNGDSDILLFASSGKAARFHESKVRAMGRTAAGVRGLRMVDDHELMALIILDKSGEAGNTISPCMVGVVRALSGSRRQNAMAEWSVRPRSMKKMKLC